MRPERRYPKRQGAPRERLIEATFNRELRVLLDRANLGLGKRRHRCVWFLIRAISTQHRYENAVGPIEKQILDLYRDEAVLT